MTTLQLFSVNFTGHIENRPAFGQKKSIAKPWDYVPYILC
jgi:hypothetical protein